MKKLKYKQLSEEKLNHSQTKKLEELEIFFSVIPDLLCITNTEGIFIRLNNAWEATLGFSVEYLMNKNYLSLVHPDDILKTLEADEMIKQANPVINFINRYRCLDGSYKYLEWHAYQYGDVIYSSARDITMRIMLEDELKKQKERIELVLKGSADGIWDVNPISNDVYLSPRWKEQLGYNDAELANSTDTFFNLLHPEDKDKVLDSLNCFINSDIKLYNFAYRMLSKNGSYRWIWARGESLKDENGKVFRIVGSHTDITSGMEASAAADEREKYLRAILDTTQDGFQIITEGGVINDVNDAYCRMTGYTKEDLKSIKMLELQVETLDQAKDQIDNIIANGSDTFETQHRRKDGSVFDAEVSAACLTSEPLTMICFIRDITRRKISERSLSRSHNLMRYIIEHNRIAVAVHDKDLNFMYVSRRYLEFYNLEGQDIIGKNHYEVFPYFPEPLRDVHRRVLAGEIIGKDEDPNIQADGTIEWTRWECRPWLEEDGTIGGMILYSEIITESKMLQQTIFNEKELFKTTLFSVGDGVLSTDSLGNIIVMNPIAEKLTGITLSEAYGKPLKDVFNIISDDDSANSIVDLAERVLETGQIFELSNNTFLISKTGAQLPIEDSAAPIRDSNGNISGVVIVFRDFTEKKEKQKQIEYLSFNDHLTGLYNRRYMEDALNRLDTKRNLPLAVMVLDVNGLKLTNDAFGHEMGDLLLKKVVEITKKVCRTDDIIGRMGGDEFCILLPGTDAKKAEGIKQRIIKAASGAKLGSVIVSIAIGYAVKIEEDQDIYTVLTAADNQMYKDKIKNGRIMRSQTIETVLRNVNLNYDQEQIHTERVSQYCEAISSAMGLKENEIRDIKTAGVLHDIGKIVISPELLKKEGKLTADEFEIIKRHPETGYQMLKSVDEYVNISEYILYHHEKWDGSGYPLGLKGDKIPLQSRIIAVADAFEAMTAKRPYQNSKTVEEAKEELKRFAGIQFDPEIVLFFTEKVL